MSPRYSYQLHNAHRRPPYAHPLQELQEVEAEEVEVEEEEQTSNLHPTSDSAETPLKYSREKERKQTASSLNSNAITLISSISGTERGEVRGVFWTDSGPCHVTHVRLLIRRTDDSQAD